MKSDIDKLPGHKLGQLMNFIQAREPSLSSAVNEIEVDIEMLRPSTLRALQNFVTVCLKKSSKSVHSEYTLTLSGCSVNKVFLETSVCSDSYFFCPSEQGVKANGRIQTTGKSTISNKVKNEKGLIALGDISHVKIHVFSCLYDSMTKINLNCHA